MINNAPDSEIFLKNSAEFMFEAIQIVYSLIKDEFISTVLEDEWLEETNSVKIGTISLLIFSSIENYLKYKISKESPFLLISSLSDLKRGKSDFNEYHMHSFEDLLQVYITIYGITNDDQLKTKFDNLRKTRNLFVHSTLKNGTYISDLFKCAAFFVKEVWNANLSEHRTIFYYFAERLDPLFDYNDVVNFLSAWEEDNESHAELLTMYEILKHYLTANETLSFLGLSKFSRLEICPVCAIYSWRITTIEHFRFAKLIVEDGYEYLYCQLCQAKVLTTTKESQNLKLELDLPVAEQPLQTTIPDKN